MYVCPSTEGDIFVMTEGEKGRREKGMPSNSHATDKRKKQTLQCKQDNADQNQR